MALSLGGYVLRASLAPYQDYLRRWNDDSSQQGVVAPYL